MANYIDLKYNSPEFKEFHEFRSIFEFLFDQFCDSKELHKDYKEFLKLFPKTGEVKLTR